VTSATVSVYTPALLIHAQRSRRVATTAARWHFPFILQNPAGRHVLAAPRLVTHTTRLYFAAPELYESHQQVLTEERMRTAYEAASYVSMRPCLLFTHDICAYIDGREGPVPPAA
jgi:hypothetical protein